MKLLDNPAKTNWKFIAIVAFVAVFLMGGILMLIPQFQEQTPPPPPLPQPNTSQIDTFGPALSPSTELGINSVEGWQTYRNEEFGFEVRYPSGIFAIVPAEEYIYPDSPPRYEGMKLIFAGVAERLGKKECFNDLGGFTVVCDAGEQNGISFVVVDKGISHFTREGDPGEGEKEVTIGGRKSVRYTYGLEGYNTEHYYIPIEAEQTVIITVSSTFNYESQKRSPSHELVDQILSTFRFVE